MYAITASFPIPIIRSNRPFQPSISSVPILERPIMSKRHPNRSILSDAQYDALKSYAIAHIPAPDSIPLPSETDSISNSSISYHPILALLMNDDILSSVDFHSFAESHEIYISDSSIDELTLDIFPEPIQFECYFHECDIRDCILDSDDPYEPQFIDPATNESTFLNSECIRDRAAFKLAASFAIARFPATLSQYRNNSVPINSPAEYFIDAAYNDSYSYHAQ